MDAAGGGVLVESRSTLMGVLLVLWVFGTIFTTLDDRMDTAMEREFFGGSVVGGGLVMIWMVVLVEQRGGVLRGGLVAVLFYLLGRAMVSR